MNNKNQKYIILLNGLSSSGKSTIINEISILHNDIGILKVDDWFPTIVHQKAESLGWTQEHTINPWSYLHNYAYETTGTWHFDVELRALLFNEARGLYQKALDIHTDGRTVIIDTVLETHQDHLLFDNFFKHHNVLKLLVYCPMDRLLERVEKRNLSENISEHRTSFQSFEQFYALFKTQTHETEQTVDTVKSLALKGSLERSVQDLINNNIQNPYSVKLHAFKQDFIQQFNLATQENITLVTRHAYDCILYSHKDTPQELAKKIILLSASHNYKS